jgi:PAS domain S-box-containing protein
MIHPLDKARITDIINNSIDNKLPYEYECRLITKAGKIKTIYVKASLQLDAFGSVIKILGIIQDISARKQAEYALQQSEDQFRSLFENARDPIMLLNEKQQFIDCNQATVKILGGTEKSQILFHTPAAFSPEYQSDGMLSSEKSKHMDQQAFADGSTQFEWLHKRLDGSIFPVDVSLTKIPRGDENILLVHWRDITQQQEANNKLEAQNAELLKTNAELDKFVYSVSHDLRAPLSSMLGVVEIVKEDCVEKELNLHLNMLEGSIKKLDGFIEDILNYSRNSRLEVEYHPVNIAELVHDIRNNLQYMQSNTSQQVCVNIDVNSNAILNTDRSRLYIILNNLISNAIRYQNPEVENPLVNISIDLSDTETNIIVQDNGIGISQEHQKKIFDMFYRVSKNSVGSGLGLYIVKEIVSKLNGKIDVNSTPGIGTAFKVAIPTK